MPPRKFLPSSSPDSTRTPNGHSPFINLLGSTAAHLKGNRSRRGRRRTQSLSVSLDQRHAFLESLSSDSQPKPLFPSPCSHGDKKPLEPSPTKAISSAVNCNNGNTPSQLTRLKRSCTRRHRRSISAVSLDDSNSPLLGSRGRLNSFMNSLDSLRGLGTSVPEWLKSTRPISLISNSILPHVPTSFTSAIWSTTKLPLYLFNQVPRYLQDNEFIFTGYRSNYTYAQSWRSIFALHNETGNIWTHLVGLALFSALAFLAPHLLSLFSMNMYDAWDVAIFLIFILSACKCFAFSTLFHTHYCNSHRAFVCFGCLDYAGISILISGSSAVVTYYIHYCNNFVRRSYLLLLSFIGFVGVVGPMFPIWCLPRFRPHRTFIYMMSAFMSAAPIVHFIVFAGTPDSLQFWAKYGWFLMGGIYIVGAIIYAFKIPERWYPGKLDICGHSHQIWHIFVVCAALVHLLSSLELMFWRLTNKCLPPGILS